MPDETKEQKEDREFRQDEKELRELLNESPKAFFEWGLSGHDCKNPNIFKETFDRNIVSAAMCAEV